MVYVTKPMTISRHLKLTGGLEAENEAMVLVRAAKIDKMLVKIGDAVTVGGSSTYAAIESNSPARYCPGRSCFASSERPV